MKGVEVEVGVAVPSYLRCPISLEVMKDPVTLCTGLTYDRQSIETWLDARNNVCPVTNQVLHTQDLIPNHTLRRFIQDWCVANSGNGVQRIPTPKVPVNAARISEILAEISAGDREGIGRLTRLAKESDRNRKCIASSNAASVVASIFSEQSIQALNRSQQSVEICEEAVGILAMILPINTQAHQLLASYHAMGCLVSILQQGNVEAKKNAAVLLQEMVSKNKQRERIGSTDGLAEGLVQLLREPMICPAARKASFAVIYNIAVKKKTRVKVVEAGAVPLLVENIVVETERGICERGLLALDILCNCTEGRLAASAHALTVPLLVKKLLRVSPLATDLAVSVLWNICQNSSDGSSLLEALQVGAFHKLLLLVQLGCGETTRDKATKLLKLLNNYRGDCDCDCDCTETMNFNNVKRSF